MGSFGMAEMPSQLETNDSFKFNYPRGVSLGNGAEILRGFPADLWIMLVVPVTPTESVSAVVIFLQRIGPLFRYSFIFFLSTPTQQTIWLCDDLVILKLYH